jgi:hypothetical protein
MECIQTRLLVLFISGILTACGGGGGGSAAPSSSSPTLSSISYSGSNQVYTYSDGSTVTYTPTSSSESWAGDHVTRTTTHTYADGNTNAVTDTVSPTLSYSYSGSTQTTTSTYGDGHITTSTSSGTIAYTYSGSTETTTITFPSGHIETSTATATGSSISWAGDHVTKTTTYTYASGGSNSVTSTVNPTYNTVSLTAADWITNRPNVSLVIPPSTSAKVATYGDGHTATVEDGTSSKPFAQSTLTAVSITDPNAHVSASSGTYDLTWGTPDDNGPNVYAGLYNTSYDPVTTSNQLPFYISYAGVTLYDRLGGYPWLSSPSDDVWSLMNYGWTGLGTNVLVIDGYASIGSCTTSVTCHGITTMLITDWTAPGATKYYLDYGNAGTIPSGTITANTGGGGLTSSTTFQAVNASFGGNYLANGLDPSSASDRAFLATAMSDMITTWTNVFNGTTTLTNAVLTDAVIAKSAGNDSTDSSYEPFVSSYANDANISPRLLIVGALDKDGKTTSRASLATYSNYAGASTSVSDRFLLANGKAPWLTNDIAANGFLIAGADSGNVGTSYAAPRVAGYASMLRQKFPNLTGEQSASILLDTARYDTLSCYPSCSAAVYGKGEASIWRAMTPVGSLR